MIKNIKNIIRIFFIGFYILLLTQGAAYSIAQNNPKPLCPSKKMYGSPMEFFTVIFGQLISFTWKDSKDAFCIAQRYYQKHIFSITQIPQGTTLDSAKEQLTILSFPKILVPNEDFLNGMVKLQSSCEKILTKTIKNKKDVLEFVIISDSCKNTDSHKAILGKSIGRIDHYVMKRRGGNTYIFGYLLLGKTFDTTKYNFNNDNFKRWSNLLNNIKITPTPINSR